MSHSTKTTKAMPNIHRPTWEREALAGDTGFAAFCCGCEEAPLREGVPERVSVEDWSGAFGSDTTGGTSMALTSEARSTRPAKPALLLPSTTCIKPPVDMLRHLYRQNT
jgi:hypothetical protein